MLVLSRRVGEKIKIGDTIEIMLVDARGGNARIGVTAPQEVPVYREEVYEAIQAERRKLTERREGG